MKKIFLSILAIAFLTVALTSSAYAECSGGHCALKGKSSHGSKGCDKSGGCPIVEKLMKKAHFFLENQKELGLKDDQIQTIKGIKMEAKKASIRQYAEMQVFQMDLESKLSEPQVDIEGLNTMIDDMSAAMGSAGKATVAAYAKLKSVLSTEQMTKAKELWMQKKHSH